MSQDRWKIFDMKPDYTLQELTVIQAIKIGRINVAEDKALAGDTPETGEVEGSTRGEPQGGPGAWAIAELMRNH